VMLFPATAVAGALFTIDTSACALTVVIAVWLSLDAFGSLLDVDAVAVLLMIVPFAIVAAGCTVRVNCALVPFPRTAIVQATVGPPPQEAAGPVSCTIDTKARPAGNTSVKEASMALSGPLFERVMM